MDSFKACKECGQLNVQDRWRCHLCECVEFFALEEYMNINSVILHIHTDAIKKSIDAYLKMKGISHGILWDHRIYVTELAAFININTYRYTLEGKENGNVRTNSDTN